MTMIVEAGAGAEGMVVFAGIFFIFAGIFYPGWNYSLGRILT
jgi:hypothetical protein